MPTKVGQLHNRDVMGIHRTKGRLDNGNEKEVEMTARWTALRCWGVVLTSVSMALVMACTGGSGSDQGDDDDLGTSVVGKSGLDPNLDFPFEVYTGSDRLGGSSLKLSDLAGTPIVLNFWAGLCPPCRAEMPDLQEFDNEFKDRVVLLGIDVGPFTGLGDRADALALLDLLDVTYPTGFTSDETVAERYRLFSMPTTFFINAEGKQFSMWPGLLTKKRLIQVTEEMLAEHSESTS